ncbi:MAG: sulfurtransferase-like selenium metabolism protein YedF [Chloroflexi bacterium]|nr:sulfurtransferase-like selenium metabolism protein YedF [Chloroflexota bacterium]
MTLRDSVILVTREGMGNAVPPLPLKLISKYFELILENGDLPNAICFYTEGVKLVCEESPVLDILHSLESRGVRLLACSTCLDFYNLSGRQAVGIPGGMTDILEAQVLADKVITL